LDATAPGVELACVLAVVPVAVSVLREAVLAVAPEVNAVVLSSESSTVEVTVMVLSMVSVMVSVMNSAASAVVAKIMLVLVVVVTYVSVVTVIVLAGRLATKFCRLWSSRF
jgi:hypothetical protein